MTSIDERVVSLVFENKQFESAVKSALNTLNNLKKNLNFDKESSEFANLERASEEVDFSQMAANLDIIAGRFSNMGIVGMTVLSNLTTSAMNTAKNILSYLGSALIGGGKRRALAIEQAKFQFEGLGMDVKASIQSANDAVSGTAFGLDAAAKAAAMLGASGMQAGEDMTHALRAVAGAAAMTNSEYEEIANIFTTVAGNGRLMGDQLLQFANRGLNVAAELGKQMGKTELEIRDMVSKGQIDFKTFYEAMYDAFGEQAAKANETFTGSLANMRSALARIGAEFATPVYQNMIRVFNALRLVFDGLKASLKPVMDYFAEFMEVGTKIAESVLSKIHLDKTLATPMRQIADILKNLVLILYNLFSFVISIVRPIVAAFNAVFGDSILGLIVRATEAIKNFTARMKVLDTQRSVLRNIRTTFEGIFIIVKAVVDVITKLVGIVANVVFDVFIKVFGFLGQVLFSITGFFGQIIIAIRDFVRAILDLTIVRKMFEIISNVVGATAGAFTTVYDAVTNLILALMDAVFTRTASVFKHILDVILALAKGIDAVVRKMVEFAKYVYHLPQVQQTIEKVNHAFSEMKSNVGAVASDLRDKFLKAFEKAKTVVGEFINKVRDLISQYIQLPTFQEVVSNLQQFIADSFEKSAEIFSKVKEVFIKIFEKVKELNEISLKNAIENFGKLRDKVVEIVNVTDRMEAIKKFFVAIRNGITTLVGAISGAVDGAQGELSQFIQWVKTKFGNISIGDIMAAGVGAGLLAFIFQITRFTSTLNKVVTPLEGLTAKFAKIPSAITKSLDSITNYFNDKRKAEKLEAVANIIKAFGQSILMIAASVAILASMDSAAVREAAISLGILSGALVLLTAVATVLVAHVHPEVIAKMAITMISASGSMLLLAISLRTLADLELGKIVSSLITMGILMAEFAGFLIIVNKFAPEVQKASFSLVGFAITMLLLSNAIKRIGGINPLDILSAVAVFSAMTVLVSVMMIVADKHQGGLKAAASVILLVLAMQGMLLVIKSLAKTDFKTLTVGLLEMMAILLVINNLFNMMTKATNNILKAGAAILLITVALMGMKTAINQLASIESSTLNRAMRSLVGVTVIIGMLMAVTRLAGKNSAKAGIAMMAASASILILSGAIMLLGQMRDEEIERATNAITKIMAMFALIVAATGVVKKADKVIKTMTVSLGVLAASLMILALIEPENLKGASTALSMVMGTFAILVASTSLVTSAQKILWQMTAMIALLAGVLAALSILPVEHTLEIALSLSALLLALSGSLLILQNIKAVSPQALLGLAELAGVILAIAAVFATLGGLIALIPGAQEFLENGIPILEALGQALGSFVGGVIGGLLGGMSSGLIEVADNLSAFMEHLDPFLERVKTIDPSVQDGINAVIGMILSLAAADFISSLGIFSGAGTAIQDVADNLPTLGEGIKNYANAIAGMDTGTIENTSTSIRIITELLNNLPRSGGLWGILAGDVNMSDVAENLPKLGEGLKSFSESMRGFDVSAVESTEAACQIIISLASSLPNTWDGLIGLFTGGSDMSIFSEQLPNFAQALVDYSDIISDLDTNAVKGTEEAAKIILALADAVPNNGVGFFEAFGVHTNWGTLKNNLTSLADAMVSYSDKIGDLRSDAVNSTKDAAEIILKLAEATPDTSNGIFAPNKFDDFKTNVTSLGEGLVSYSDAMADFKSDKVISSFDAVSKIFELSKMIPETGGGLFGMLTGEGASMANFGNQLKDFADGMVSYSTAIADLDSGSVQNTEQAARIIIELAKLTEVGEGQYTRLVTYAEQLPAFGHAIFMYAQNIAGMDTQSVYNTENAARMIIALAGIQDIPTDTRLSTFSNQLPQFGHNLFMFAQNIGGMDTGSVYNTVEACRRVIDLTRYFLDQGLGEGGYEGTALGNVGLGFQAYWIATQNIDIDKVNAGCDAIRNIGDALKALPEGIDLSSATNSINDFINAAKNMGEEFVKTMNETKNQAIKAAQEMVTQAASAATQAIDNAKAQLLTRVKGSIEYVISMAILVMVTNKPKFRSHAEALMMAIGEGFESKRQYLIDKIKSILASCVEAIGSFKERFREVGRSLDEGMVQGLEDNKQSVINKAKQIAEAAAAAAKAASQINSPSKVFAEIGYYMIAGWALGLDKNGNQVVSAVEGIAYDAIDAVSMTISAIEHALDDSLNVEPTITPVLDTSLIDKGIAALNGSFGSAPMLGVGGANNLAFALSNMSRNRRALEEIQNGSRGGDIINNYDMTQNNYSPKALNRSEIFRQTRNQFSRLKERTSV